MLSAVTTSLLLCAVKLFIWYVAVCCLCVCVPDVLVCGMFGCETTCLVQLLPSLLVCVVKLFIWYVAVCCLCVCVPDVLVCGMFGCFTEECMSWFE